MLDVAAFPDSMNNVSRWKLLPLPVNPGAHFGDPFMTMRLFSATVAPIAAVAIAAVFCPPSAEATQPPRDYGSRASQGNGSGLPTRGVARSFRQLSPRARRRIQSIFNYTTKRGLTGMARRARQARRAIQTRSLRIRRGIAPGAAITLPTAVRGTRSIPVITTTFQDTPSAPFPVSQLQQQLFDGPWPTGTMTDYYREISHGLFTVTGTVFNWVALAKRAELYTGPAGCFGILCPAEFPKLKNFIVETLSAADPNVDFRQYDNDGPDGIPNSGDDDGFVDFVALVHPQVGGECTGAANRGIWSHRWAISNFGGGDFETGDTGHNGRKIRIDDYVIMPALACDNTTMIQIGVFAHEFGHAFGLPDLYDTDNSNGVSAGIGGWGLMAGGSWGGSGNQPQFPSHMTAWSKQYLGWQNAKLITTDTKDVTLPIASRNPAAVHINIDSDKNYLIEHRAPEGFDRSLPGQGLLVYRVNNPVIRAGLRNNRVNADENNKGLGVVEADGRTHLDDAVNPSDDGDLFPGATSNVKYDRNSNPASQGNIALCNIRANATEVKFDVYTSRATCPAPTTKFTLSSNVLFEFASYDLKPAAEPELRAIADRIKASSNAQVLVHGHTDSSGSEALNLELSRNRADVVRQFLQDAGVIGSMMQTIAHGEANLIGSDGKPVSVSNPEDPARSRRVVVEVVARQIAAQ